MIPLSFDPITARALVGDTEARKIEEKARSDADQKIYDPPSIAFETYWGKVLGRAMEIVYKQQYYKRWERNLRKQMKESP